MHGIGTVIAFIALVFGFYKFLDTKRPNTLITRILLIILIISVFSNTIALPITDKIYSRLLLVRFFLSKDTQSKVSILTRAIQVDPQYVMAYQYPGLGYADFPSVSRRRSFRHVPDQRAIDFGHRAKNSLLKSLFALVAPHSKHRLPLIPPRLCNNSTI